MSGTAVNVISCTDADGIMICGYYFFLEFVCLFLLVKKYGGFKTLLCFSINICSTNEFEASVFLTNGKQGEFLKIHASGAFSFFFFFYLITDILIITFSFYIG